MKWINDSCTSSHEVYHLFKSGKKVLTLSFNSASNSARIDMEREKRVLLLRKEGFLKKRTVIRSEYGIRIAELGRESKGEFIDINEQRYYYELRTGANPQLILYRDAGGTAVITCSLDTTGSGTCRFLVTGLLMALSSAVLPATIAVADPAV
ncbi:MAG TPA: hypothetical protein VEB63_01715 [Chitinophagaceae bacterium]|nr:hypothetical protein [Chitinophagaceae bacterium]